MSVTAPASRPVAAGAFAGTRVRALARSDTVVLACVALWSVLLAVLMWGTWGDLTMDTGYDLVASARVAHGQLPYIDFDYWYGPLPVLLLGGIYAVTGTAVWPAVALGLVLTAAAIALTYRLARAFVDPVPAGLAAALVAPLALSSANNSYVLPHSTSAPLALVLALGALLVLVRHEQGGGAGRRALVVAGTLVALVAVTRLELALAVYAALGTWLLIRIRLGDRRAGLRDALAVLVPALALPALVYAPFAASVGLHDLLTVNLYPRAFVQAAGHVILDSHAPKTPASVAKLLGYTALYAAGLAGLLVLARGVAAGGRRRTLALAAAGAAGFVFLAVLAARPETVRFYLTYAYAWIPAGAWVAAGALAWRARRAGAWAPAERGALLLTLVLGFATITTYASFKPFPNAAFPEATPYVLPFAAVVLAWLHAGVLRRTGALGIAWLALLATASAGLALHDARAETATVSGAHGSFTALPADAPALQGALGLIARETRPGDPILLAPQLSSLYVLSGRNDPLPQISLLPGALPTPADEDRAIRRMDAVRLVLVDRTPLTSYHHGAFGTTFDRHLAAWLRRDFRRVTTLGGKGQDATKIDAWLRRS